LMESVLDDRALEEAVLASQDAALDRLLARDFAGTLLRFVNQVISGPPRQAPDVPWDFWPQFDQFERLEELRQFRPALFQALPAQAEESRGPSRETRASTSGAGPR